MKKMLTVTTVAFALMLSLASCAAPLPETAPQTAERPVAASPAPSSTPEPTVAVAPVDLTEPPAAVVPEPTPALTITAVEPMAFAATLDPPDYSSVFEVRDAGHGYTADTTAGPRFLLSHAMSLGNPPAPGNDWQALQEGQTIEALGSDWTITSRIEAPKNWPADDSALVERTYGASPGTLVLVTCVPRWEGRATHNLILIAELEGTS